MHAVRQEDDVGIGRRVEPERRSGEAGMAERPERQQLPPVRREHRVDVPAEAAPVPLARRRRHGGHPGNGERRERSHAVHRAAAQQHPTEDRQIGRRAEQPGVAGHTSHPARRRVVHRAAEHHGVRPVARPTQRWTRLGRRNPWHQRRRRVEHRVAHAERHEDPLADVVLERQAGHPRHDLAEQEEVDVAVDEPLAWRRQQHLLGRAVNGDVVAVELVLQRQVRPETGHVRQQVADGDVFLAVTRELRDERADPIGQPDPAGFDELHHARRRGDDLREGGEVEDGVARHRLPRRRQGPVPERLVVNDLVTPSDEDDGARQPASLDRLLDQRVHPRQSRGVDGLGSGGPHAAQRPNGQPHHQQPAAESLRHRLDYTGRHETLAQPER